MSRLLPLAFVGLLLPATAAADYERAMLAFERGDYARAYAELLSEARRGHGRAQYNIANMLANGTGIPSSPVEATNWYARAAKQGVLLAQYELGKRLASGVGAATDELMAYVWFSVAGARGHRNSHKNKLILEKRLSASALDRGYALAEEYFQRYGEEH